MDSKFIPELDTLLISLNLTSSAKILELLLAIKQSYWTFCICSVLLPRPYFYKDDRRKALKFFSKFSFPLHIYSCKDKDVVYKSYPLLVMTLIVNPWKLNNLIKVYKQKALDEEYEKIQRELSVEQ